LLLTKGFNRAEVLHFSFIAGNMAPLRMLLIAALVSCTAALVPTSTRLPVARATAAALAPRGEMFMRSRVCELTGARRNQKRVVTFSHIRNKKTQEVNLQEKKFWWPEGNRFVKMRVSCKAIKTIAKYGIEKACKKYAVDPAKH
jgi:large subunit ribosomal protein L28